MTDQVAVEVPRVARVEARHAAAAILGEVRAQQAEVVRIQSTRDEKDGQAMFRGLTGQEVELSGEPNLENIGRAIKSRDDEVVNLDNSEDPQKEAKKRVATEKQQRLEVIRIAIEEIKNDNVSANTLNLVGQRLARIPGVCTGLAFELGVETDEIRVELSGGSIGERLEGIILGHLGSEAFKARLITNFNEGQLSPELEAWEDEIASLLESIKLERVRIANSRDKIKDDRNKYRGYTEDLKSIYNNDIKRREDYVKTLTLVNNDLTGGGLDFNNPDDVEEFIRLVPNYKPQNTSDPNNLRMHNYYTAQEQTAQRLLAILKNSNLNEYEKSKKANETGLQLDQQEKELRRQEVALRQRQVARHSALESYENKTLSALDRAVGGYWNNIILEEAKANAVAEAGQKAEDKAKAKERGETAEEMLDKFMLLSFHKYKHDAKSRGQVSDGWDDNWIKDMVSQSVGHGPQAMAESFIRHLLSRRYQLPEDVRRNVEEALGKINKDHPEDPLSVLDSEALRRIGKKFVPLVWGAGEIRGYTLGRRKVTGPQALTLTLEYGDDFWKQVDESSVKLQAVLDSQYGKNTTKASELGKKIRQEFSADNISQNKLKFLMELLGLIGLVGVGALLPGLGPLIAGGALAGGVATLSKLKSRS